MHLAQVAVWVIYVVGNRQQVHGTSAILQKLASILALTISNCIELY